MATIAQIITDVTGETRRPDLSARIERAVKNAVLRLHQSELFARDLNEGVISGGPYTSAAPDSRYVIPVSALTGFRLLSKFHDYDATYGIVGREYSIEDNPNYSLNSFGSMRTRMVRMVGTNLVVLAGDTVGSTRNFYASWYKDPDVSNTANSTWITEKYQYAVMWAAVAQIHRSNGKAEEANTAQADAMTEYNNILINNITLQGR